MLAGGLCNAEFAASDTAVAREAAVNCANAPSLHAAAELLPLVNLQRCHPLRLAQVHSSVLPA